MANPNTPPPSADNQGSRLPGARKRRSPSDRRRDARRAIEKAANRRLEAWRHGERRDVRELTVDLNGKVSARETSDASETDARGDDGYLRERDTGLFAELRKAKAKA